MDNLTFTSRLKNGEIAFKEVLAFIEDHYIFSPTAFSNGDLSNAADQNQGSCKVFALGEILKFDKETTLSLFCEHYQAVKNTPEGEDHQNIRNFMKTGFEKIAFDKFPLIKK